MTSITDSNVITASGGLVELGYTAITSPQNVSTTSPTTVVIPTLTVVSDGSPMLVEFFSPAVRPDASVGQSLSIALMQNGSLRLNSWAFFTTTASGTNDWQPASLSYRVTLPAGSHTFEVRAQVSAGTGTIYAGTGANDFAPAFLRVSKIVQATQWPAVTTGTIVCTSTTRPSSPFVGQQIFEADTLLSKIWNGSSWVSPATVNGPPMIQYAWNPFNITTGTLVNQTVNTTPSSTPFSQGGWSISSGVITYPEPGIYSSSLYASPVSGSGFFPITIGIQNNNTCNAPQIYQSLPSAGWASYSSIIASGVHVVNGDRQIILKVGVNATSGWFLNFTSCKIGAI